MMEEALHSMNLYQFKETSIHENLYTLKSK